ncbi:hypothetical protein SUGI_0373020 [Cryptomeria japonica]|nr:hypothetical protein SUGI_0373020 [Cryptomeria japonica]
MEKVISRQSNQDLNGDGESTKPTIKDWLLQGRLCDLQDGLASGQYNNISSYEVMAREHGKLIIPHISEIMRNVLKVLSSDAPSLALQQECVKVVLALARYAIEPSSFERNRERVIRDLASPLLEVLLGNVRSLAEGAAMCLQALVNTEVWKFAPDKVVNEICLRVTAALEEKETQTTDHMKLVCSLAEHNSFILEAYGGSLLGAAHDILSISNSQLRLNAILMINALLKNVNAYMIDSEIPFTITNMERFTIDRIPSIKDAATETLQIAKEIVSEEGMDVGHETFSSEVGNANEDVTPRKIIGPGMSEFPKKKYFYSCTDPLASLLHSFNANCQTPSVLSSTIGATSSCSLHVSQGYEAALTEKIRDSTFSMQSEISHSKTATIARDMATEQTPCSALTHKGGDSESGGYFIRKPLFENEDMKTRRYMLREKENGDESRKHSWIKYSHSPAHSDVTEEKDSGRPKTAEPTRRTGDMKLKEFTPISANVGSLQQHSCPQVTRRKSQSKSRFTDFTYDNNDKHDSSRDEETGQMTAALKGKTWLHKLESFGDRFSDQSNSQEGSIQNSSAWSESVQKSYSLSPTSSSSTLYEDASGNEEGYLNPLSIQPDKQTPRMDAMEENSQPAEVNSREASVYFPMFEETSRFGRGWKKAMYLMKSMLERSLCAVLVVPATMIAVELFSLKDDYHVLVPT